MQAKKTGTVPEEDPAREYFEIEASALKLNVRKATIDKKIADLENEENELKGFLRK